MSQKNILITLDDTPVVTLEDFKKHIKWDQGDSTEDTLMSVYIKSATQLAEKITRRQLFKGDWETKIDNWPDKIRLEINPVDLDSIVVNYYDTNDEPQELSEEEYLVHNNGPDDFTEIEFNGSKPELSNLPQAVVIEYNAGYGKSNTPEMIKVAIMKRAAKDVQHRVDGDADANENEFYRDLFQFKMLWEE